MKVQSDAKCFTQLDFVYKIDWPATLRRIKVYDYFECADKETRDIFVRALVKNGISYRLQKTPEGNYKVLIIPARLKLKRVKEKPTDEFQGIRLTPLKDKYMKK